MPQGSRPWGVLRSETINVDRRARRTVRRESERLGAGVDQQISVPEDIDVEQPSAARVYDYYLGGSHNFAADRAMAQQAIQMWPDLPQIMQANRGFLRRCVEHLVEAGIDQFIDLGSGIPTAGNVHEVARRANVRARVVYVDIDPVAVAHSQALLAGDDQTNVIQADLRRPDDVLAHPTVQQMIDFDQPVAVLMIAVLHFIADEDQPADVVARYADAGPSGSHLAISHASHEGRPEQTGRHAELYQRTRTPMNMRSREQIAALFSDLEMVPPGLVWLPSWRPDPGDPVDPHPERTTGLCGVGRVR